jgi:ABC-2 type transport system permease protein
MSIAVRHTWFMVGRQLRNLMREPIWIALLLVQPMVWLLLYGQLFKRVTHLPGGGFGTTSYITFLAPAIVIMNAFFGATWSGMAMISDLDRDVLPRFLATPVSRISLVVSQIVRSALIAVIQGAIILLVSIALGVRVHTAVLGWIVVLLAAALMNSAFAGLSQGIALLVRKEATMIAIANFIGLPLFFLSSTLDLDPSDPPLDADRGEVQSGQLGRHCCARGRLAGHGLELGGGASRAAARAFRGDRGVRNLDVPGVPTDDLKVPAFLVSRDHSQTAAAAKPPRPLSRHRKRRLGNGRSEASSPRPERSRTRPGRS